MISLTDLPAGMERKLAVASERFGLSLARTVERLVAERLEQMEESRISEFGLPVEERRRRHDRAAAYDEVSEALARALHDGDIRAIKYVMEKEQG